MIRQLNDSDIANMIGDDFVPDCAGDKSVRCELHLSTRIPQQKKLSEHVTIDFHQHTEEQAWAMLVDAIESGVRSATIITGASGILKPKFQQWVTDSIISSHIISCTPINNGSFSVKFRKLKQS